MAGQTPRAVAARCLETVLVEGRSLDEALAAVPTDMDPRDRALVRALCYGVLRWYPRLTAVAGQLLHKPLKNKDADIYALLLSGLLQLSHMDIPAHAAVGETVAAARALHKPWARGLLNANLRRFQRESDSLLEAVDRRAIARLAHPGWFLKRLRTDWPDQWEHIATANNQRAPMALRVNPLQGTVDAYAGLLSAADLSGHGHPHAEAALVLDRPVDVGCLPGFSEGRISIQDPAAQLAAWLVDPQPGERILDACAAPGGKTAHLLEHSRGEARVLALDADPRRLASVEQNLDRLGLSAALIEGDAGDPEAWWDGEPFDRILVDAPCSSSGVVRRHPDIKYLRRDEDIAALATRQQAILKALWPLLRKGGRLVYATCSVFKTENEEVAGGFGRDHPDAVEAMPTGIAWGRSSGPGRQILPGEDDMDGFYYACWTKSPVGSEDGS